MSAGRFLTATIAGGLTLFIVGYLIYGLAFMGFFEAHAGTATGVMKETPDFVFLVLGQFAWAALLTVIVGTWANVSGFGPALKVGALTGILSGLAFNLTFYATANISDLTATLVDPLLGAVWSGLGAGVIGVVLARGDNPT